MQIDFSTPILDLKGNTIKDGENDFLLSTVACNALLQPYQDEQNLNATEKLRRYKIATKVSDGGVQDLSVEDVAELKKLIGKGFPPLVVGRSFDILEGSK